MTPEEFLKYLQEEWQEAEVMKLDPTEPRAQEYNPENLKQCIFQYIRTIENMVKLIKADFARIENDPTAFEGHRAEAFLNALGGCIVTQVEMFVDIQKGTCDPVSLREIVDEAVVQTNALAAKLGANPESGTCH